MADFTKEILDIEEGNVPEEERDVLLLHDIAKYEEYEDSVEKYRKIAQAGIAQWIKDFKNNKIKLNTVDDLERLIKIDLQLQKGRY
ncbi:hypothetical protein FZD47_25380 [Bacillus infantis]|uniref:Uncharacterized protein n=1 Tax=Bacillus infantis TaxID=324767 RepID=A0A5D4RWM2_9BACI|nr:hypothetical protein [Bacillus infantis]TYS55763.1 hypothetical protein FZD47_25380 [Bacillus infantis]